MDKMNRFCTHIRAALACYIDMTPEQQSRAVMYTARKFNALAELHAASSGSGGELAGALLQKTQRPANP